MAASRGASTPFLRIPRRLGSCRSLSSRAPSSAAAAAASTGEARGERERRKNYELANRPFMDDKYTLDESRSEYAIDNDPLMDDKL
jgi:hypothetical protein